MKNYQNYIIDSFAADTTAALTTQSPQKFHLGVAKTEGADALVDTTVPGGLASQMSGSLDGAVDALTSTFTLFERGVSNAFENVGFDVDLRRPFTASHPITTASGLTTDSTTTSIFKDPPDDGTIAHISKYDPSNASSPTSIGWSDFPGLFDDDGSTFANDISVTAADSGKEFGFEIHFGGTGIRLDSFEIVPNNANTVALGGMTASISYDGSSYESVTSSFDFTTIGIVHSCSIGYDSDYLEPNGNLSRGNLDNKKVKGLRLFSYLPFASNDIEFRGLKIKKIEYEEPGGVYLDNFNIKNSFSANSAGEFEYYQSFDGNYFGNPVGNFSKSSGQGYNKVFMPGLDKKTKIARFRQTSNNTLDWRIYDIEYNTYPQNAGEKSNFEFNDSVLETKAWNSSRYDGRQLSAKKINQSTIDDVGNNNKIPIIRNYTRNIYVGNEIVGMDEKDPTDPSLVQFPDYAYAQINSYITINEDGSITTKTLDPKANNDVQKKAFYRPFLQDLAEGSFCNFILGDKEVKNNLKSKYPIYFNGGQLKKLITLQQYPTIGQNVNLGIFKTPLSASETDHYITSNAVVGTHQEYSTLRPDIGAATIAVFNTTNTLALPPSDKVPGVGILDSASGAALFGSQSDDNPNFELLSTPNTGSLHNPDIYSTWFTGSLELSKYTFNSVENQWINYAGRGGGRVFNSQEFANFVQNFISYRDRSSYRGDKRLFLTACPRQFPESYFNFDEDGNRLLEGNVKPLYTYEFGNYPTSSEAINNFDLPTLATFEITNFIEYRAANGKIINHELELSSKKKPFFTGISHQEFYTIGAIPQGDSGIDNFFSGSFLFSITDDDVPSVLVPLNTKRELPGGKGNKPFAIIPENLHPYVKDNLIFYLSKAGIDIGGNATDKVEEDNSRRIGRQQPLSEAQLRELARRRREATLERSRRGRRQLRREDRQERRSERREDREERRNERRQNRNERREDRRENRNDRRENRQNRRENRRNRRRRR